MQLLKGGHFCSHMIGLLYLLQMLQEEVDDQGLFEQVYKVNPKLVHDELILVETLLLKCKWNRQKSQRKRHRAQNKDRDSSEIE